jgi:hypothetical protein
MAFQPPSARQGNFPNLQISNVHGKSKVIFFCEDKVTSGTHI